MPVNGDWLLSEIEHLTQRKQRIEESIRKAEQDRARLVVSIAKEAEQLCLERIRRLSLWDRMVFLFSPYALEP